MRRPGEAVEVAPGEIHDAPVAEVACPVWLSRVCSGEP